MNLLAAAFIVFIHLLSVCRGKKITCPGARDKLNFRQDKHIFSPNVLRTFEVKNSLIVYFSVTRTSYLVARQVNILMYLMDKWKFLDFFTPGVTCLCHIMILYYLSCKLIHPCDLGLTALYFNIHMKHWINFITNSNKDQFIVILHPWNFFIPVCKRGNAKWEKMGVGVDDKGRSGK